MAAVRLLVPAVPGSSALPRHHKATIANESLQVTFPYMDPDGDIADLARSWVEQPRPGDRKPLTRPGSPKLVKVSLVALFADPDDTQRSVEHDLDVLRMLASGRKPLVVTYGDLMGSSHWTTSGRWVVRDYSVRVQARAHEHNQVTKAEARLELLEANVPGWQPVPAVNPLTDVRVTGAGSGVPRSETIAEGDRLWNVAGRVYGNPGRWRDLGDANGVLDPRLELTPGRVLQVP